jgi:hypothetical protein
MSPWYLSPVEDPKSQLTHARFLWTVNGASEAATPRQISSFSKTFTLASAALALDSQLLIGVDGSCDVTVNGVYVGSTVRYTLPPWNGGVPMYIPTRATTATVAIALRCSNDFGANNQAGVIAALVSATGAVLGVTDGTWLRSSLSSMQPPFNATEIINLACE